MSRVPFILEGLADHPALFAHYEGAPLLRTVVRVAEYTADSCQNSCMANIRGHGRPMI